jgi:hypothetical protein
MLKLLRNNFKNKFKHNLNYLNRNFSSCKYTTYNRPIFGPGFYIFFWGSIFTFSIFSKMNKENYYLNIQLEDLKKEIKDLKKTK